jgi:hypothetical protein
LGTDDVFLAVHTLAVQGSVQRIPGDHAELEAAGLVRATADGYTLTQAGYSCHRALLDEERATIDIGLLGVAYERFACVARELEAIEARRRKSNRMDVAELSAAAQPLELILRRTAGMAPRFAQYIGRLRAARRELAEGEAENNTATDVSSLFVLIREMEEDYLQTLGRGYNAFEI